MNLQEKIKGSKPFLITGPCSAESEKQVLETGKFLKENGICDLFRAGVWKPRTRPNSFEGMGEKALPWLQKLQTETGLNVCIEVAKAQHVEAALKAGIAALWIGARSTVSPFAVQEIAEVLRGVEIPVLIKNPVNPELALWEGAFERLNAVGISDLSAIHRGFSSYTPSIYRNSPRWEIAIEFKRLHPEIPLIVDPSHICGKRELLSMVSQKAMDLDMDGLMLETHPQPHLALSDAQQQVTPENLKRLLDNLLIRKTEISDPIFENKLAELRERIDRLDEDLIQLLASRMKIIEEIGKYKKENNITILQVKRWNEILKLRTSAGNSVGLSEDFIFRVLELIHQESIRTQHSIMQ